MPTNNFDTFSMGGGPIDLDNLHTAVDAGTITIVQGGSIVVTAGTITQLPNVTLAAGTLTLGDIHVNEGTLTALGAGTITAGTINNIAGGSIVMTGGTILAGTVNNLASGTLDILKNGSIVVTAGTVTGGADGLVTIDYSHDKIHDGLMWGFSHFAGTVTAGGTVQVTYISGTTTPQVIWDIAAGAASQVAIIQNGDLTGGTLLPVHNRKIATAGSSLMSAKQGGTVAGGTALLNVYLPGGTGKGASSSVGAGLRSASEWILPASGTVTVQIIGIGASDGASINCEFYEETE
jgi:filamentous hemagglutinin